MGRGRGRGRSDLTLDVAGPGESGAPAPVEEDISEPRPGRPARAAIWVFAAVEAGAFVFYLVLARSEWFFLDEWDFLAGRGLGAHDLIREHAGHWVSVPIVVYRVLWWAVGLRSYLPYAAVAIGMHLVAAALLRIVMRRSGVDPWTATVGASNGWCRRRFASPFGRGSVYRGIRSRERSSMWASVSRPRPLATRLV